MSPLAQQLRSLIETGGVTIDAIASIVDVEPEVVERLRVGDSTSAFVAPGQRSLDPDQAARLAGLVAQLSDGMQIDDEQRIVGMLDAIESQFGMTTSSIAALISVPVDTLASMRAEPRSVPESDRLAIAVRVSYLMIAISNARSRA